MRGGGPLAWRFGLDGQLGDGAALVKKVPEIVIFV
jgi:hypothetical protein